MKASLFSLAVLSTLFVSALASPAPVAQAAVADVVEEAPAVVEEAPAVVEEAPAVVEEAPAVADEVPAVAEEAAAELALVTKISQAYDIVDTLFTNVQQYTGALNSTAATLTSESTAADNATAAIAFQDAVNNITSLVNNAITLVLSIGVTLPKRDVMERQLPAITPTALATLVTNLVLNISGALNNIISTLGLTSLLSGLSPLVTSLSNLLLSLRTVVDNLLALVQQIVDGLLVGLSAGLAGIIL